MLLLQEDDLVLRNLVSDGTVKIDVMQKVQDTVC